MTKRKVNILISLMAVALIGIMVLQVVWMNNALKVRNELFDRSVTEAISQTVKRVETLSDVFFVKDLIRPNYQAAVHQYSTSDFHVGEDSMVYSKDNLMVDVYGPHGENERKSEIRIISKSVAGSAEEEVTVEVIQLDSVINTIEERIDHNITIMVDDSRRKLGDDSTVVVKWREFSEKVGDKTDHLKNVAGKMVYESWFMAQDQKPDTASINSVLKQELQNQGIPIDFESGVFYGKNQLIKAPESDSLLLTKSKYAVNMNPNEIFESGKKLSVYFPDRRSYILKSFLWPSLLSLLFCTFILIVFSLSIYYILNQKKISEMKSDFINNMTHEFKTPLATISVATDTIVNPKVIGDADQIRHFTGVIKKENQRMNQQVESILQIARFDKRDFELQFEVVDIHEVIEKSIQINALQVENREGSIVSNLRATNSSVTTDSIHALHVLNNLLDNANKYSTEAPEITVETRNSDRGVWISVSDQGIGMNKQIQQKIFEKFYRETSGNIHNVKGFGLGLSYAKAIVEANHGEIKVNSELGKGSTFEVFFPFAILQKS